MKKSDSYNDFCVIKRYKDMDKLSCKLVPLRMLLIDEAAMLSYDLLGRLEDVISRAMRSTGTYKYRIAADGNRYNRYWGGLNILAGCDMWQEPPVTGASWWSDPRKCVSAMGEKMVNFFWNREPRFVELEAPMRFQTDPWWATILTQIRWGALTDDNYFFIHGGPTFVVGSADPNNSEPGCGNPNCKLLQGDSKLSRCLANEFSVCALS